MAQVIRKAAVAVAARPAVRQAAQPARQAARQSDGFTVVEIDQVQLATRGGGRGASPEVESLKAKLRTLRIGQGIKLPLNLQTERNVNGSIIRSYKGYNSVGKMGANEGLFFKTRRDVENNLYIFHVSPPEVVAQ